MLGYTGRFREIAMTQTPSSEQALWAEAAALVFDCDGTLADTMPAHYVAWAETARRYGLDFPEDRFYALGGVPADRIVRMLAEEQGVAVADPEAVAHEKEQRFAAHLADVQPVPEVVAIAAAYRGVKPMAVATGGFRYLVERSLGQLGILDWFDALVAAEDVAHHKPAPDTYLEAARRLGVATGDCCAFEDTDIGLTSARDAGMRVVDIRLLRER
jgi:HAD superfamily hydrolase (TIGR01509 family)